LTLYKLIIIGYAVHMWRYFPWYCYQSSCYSITYDNWSFNWMSSW